jgi:hypothetical protein
MNEVWVCGTGGMIMAGESQSSSVFWKTCLNASLSTFPTLNSKPGLHGDRPATKLLGHDTTFMVRLSATDVFAHEYRKHFAD